MFLKLSDVYKKYCLNFQYMQDIFFLTFFFFAIYKLADSDYDMEIYTSAKISIKTVIKNPEMLKFVPDHLKTKKNV